MKTSIYRRSHHHAVSHEGSLSEKEKQQEHSFFEESSHKPFFKQINENVSVLPLERTPDKKEEDKLNLASDEEKKEERLQHSEHKGEEEKLSRAPETKEEDKLQKMEAKNEEDKNLGTKE